MSKQNLHPGKYLAMILDERGLSQRELASKIDIAHSLLNNILKGNRNINVNIALSLEAAGFKKADYWMKKQIEYLLDQASNDTELKKKNELIKTQNQLEDLVPLSYFKKQEFLNIESPEDLDIIFNIYNSNSINSLKDQVENYNFNYFRKSSKFAENPKNVIAWSFLAEYKAKSLKVSEFDPINERALVKELKKCFYKNVNTLSKTKKILKKYGIKFFILDRPAKTPVDGKSFFSIDNPAIVLSLKYKRLDNFAFTIMHELGHIFLHLTDTKYKNASFFTNASNSKIEEFQADNYAKNNLIDLDLWEDFEFSNREFDDDVIYDFSNKIKVHPAIIRGRVCFENPQYYRKRSSINAINVLTY